MPETKPRTEAEQQEELWRGEFGDAYVERNLAAGKRRLPFWRDLLAEYPVERVLEVGCNVGGNLCCLAALLPAHQLFGVDVNQKALQELRKNLTDVNALRYGARELPFRDSWFDLVFTSGVLIHQPSGTLPLVMAEVVRCSRRYVLCCEYYAAETTEVLYRGQRGALFKRDFGALYGQQFPELALRKQGFLSPEQGWDNVTYWMFEKNR